MLSKNRKFHCQGELTLKKRKVLSDSIRPKDDTVNWLFLNVENHRYSFVYKIENPENAEYGEPFIIQLSFTMIDEAQKSLIFDRLYKVFRGEEEVGEIRLLNSIDYQ